MTKDEAQQFLHNHGVTHLKVVREPQGFPDALTVRLVEALQTDEIPQMRFERVVFETALGLGEGAVFDLSNHQFQALLADLVQSSVKVGIPDSVIAQ